MPTPTKLITDHLAHLVGFPTLPQDHATCAAAIDWVEQQLAGLPLHIKHHNIEGFPALIATTQPTKNPKLWLVAHIDTVPAKPSAFTAVVRDGRLHGRGSHDMKCGLAVYITLLQQLGAELTNYDLGLMVTSDEEVGGAHGVKQLLQHGYRGQTALMADSGVSWGFESGSKGVIWWDLVASGIYAHASRPWEGISAIDSLIRFIDHVRSHLVTEPCGDPMHQHATINLGIIHGGGAANQVADSATARIDIRISPDLTVETADSWIRAAEQAVPNVKTTNLLADPPYRIRNLKPMQHFKALAEDITQHKLTEAIAHGSSDARHFAVYDIPTINISPLGSGFHVPDEWVDLDSLTHYYQATLQFIYETATVSEKTT